MSAQHNDQPLAATTATPALESLLNERPSLTVATLRRSSSHVTPTRTLALSEQEHREHTPLRGGAAVVSPSSSSSTRPRSNQRTRTPRRYESPLEPGAFRREPRPVTVNHQEQLSTRITIRVGDRGTDHTRPISEVPLSHKQGPSHRKVRRWRNEHFDDLAAEVGGESKAADALRKAKEKAHLYRDIINFRDAPGDVLTRFIKDDKLQGVRDKFFECELPVSSSSSANPRAGREKPVPVTAQDKLYRVDARLRRVVTKACTNSQPAAMVVKTLEGFVCATFGRHSKKTSRVVTVPTGQWWTTLLTEAPTVTQRRDGKQTVNFLFDAKSSSGGFHRLLLHAICQFHGLQAVSRMLEIDGRSNRALIVTGPATPMSTRHLLLDQLIDDAAHVDVLEEPWTFTETAHVAEEGEWAVVKS